MRAALVALTLALVGCGGTHVAGHTRGEFLDQYGAPCWLTYDPALPSPDDVGTVWERFNYCGGLDEVGDIQVDSCQPGCEWWVSVLFVHGTAVSVSWFTPGHQP